MPCIDFAAAKTRDILLHALRKRRQEHVVLVSLDEEDGHLDGGAFQRLFFDIIDVPGAVPGVCVSCRRMGAKLKIGKCADVAVIIMILHVPI